MKLKSNKKLILCILFLVSINLSTFVYSQEFLFSDEDDYDDNFEQQQCVLDVPYIAQPQGTNWCWAASTAMVLGNKNVYVHTEQVVLAVFHMLNPMQTGDENNIARGLSYGGVDSDIFYRPLNFQQVKYIIDNGNPIIICYRGSFAGHTVVLIGYDNEDETVTIYDPVFGPFSNVPFGSSMVYGSMTGPLFWNSSIVSKY